MLRNWDHTSAFKTVILIFVAGQVAKLARLRTVVGNLAKRQATSQVSHPNARIAACSFGIGVAETVGAAYGLKNGGLVFTRVFNAFTDVATVFFLVAQRTIQLAAKFRAYFVASAVFVRDRDLVALSMTMGRWLGVGRNKL